MQRKYFVLFVFFYSALAKSSNESSKDKNITSAWIGTKDHNLSHYHQIAGCALTTPPPVHFAQTKQIMKWSLSVLAFYIQHAYSHITMRKYYNLINIMAMHIQGLIKVFAYSTIWQPKKEILRPLTLKMTRIAIVRCLFGNQVSLGISSPAYKLSVLCSDPSWCNIFLFQTLF